MFLSSKVSADKVEETMGTEDVPFSCYDGQKLLSELPKESLYTMMIRYGFLPKDQIEIVHNCFLSYPVLQKAVWCAPANFVFCPFCLRWELLTMGTNDWCLTRGCNCMTNKNPAMEALENHRVLYWKNLQSGIKEVENQQLFLRILQKELDFRETA